MKLHILSDLHIDSYQRRDLPLGNIPKTDADVIILAGDMSNSSLGMQWAIDQAEQLNTPIVYIAGNHEYFDEDIFKFDAQLQSMAENTGVTFLQKNSVDIQGVRFLGCTLWTGFNYGLAPLDIALQDMTDQYGNCIQTKFFEQHNLAPEVVKMMQQARSVMRDYRGIYAGRQMLSPEKVYEIHIDQKQWLQSALKQAHKDNVPSIAITHHGVSPQSISEKYQKSLTNATFINDLSDWMHQAWAPKLWAHGHVHDVFDYQCGKTRVVVNPRAYPKEISTTMAFDWGKVIEMDL